MSENIRVKHFPKFDENSKYIGPESSINPKRKKQHKHIYTDK